MSYRRAGCFLLSVIFWIAPLPILSRGDDNWLPANVEASIKTRVDSGINPSIVVGQVTRGGSRVFCYGTKTAGGKDAVDARSIYEIGSITKTFTCVLLADMVRKGELALNDVVEKYLPPDATAPTRGGRSIQLVHLATHTSGLPRMPDNFAPADPLDPFSDYGASQLYAFLAHRALTRDVEEGYLYSNLGMGLLGHILGRRAQTSFDVLVQERLLNELDMTATGSRIKPALTSHLAYGHHEGKQVPNWNFLVLGGAGALKSSLADMLRYLAANMGLAKTSLYESMKMTHAARPETHVMGLGWHFRKGGRDIVWHNGGTGGYRAFAGFLRDGSKGVVALTNSSVSPDDIGFHLLDPSQALRTPRRSILNAIRPVIETQGVGAAVEEYRQLKSARADQFDFAEEQLNRLGYELMAAERWDDAIEIFRLNVLEYPRASNCYDSLGEAYLNKGNKPLAIENYRISLKLNPANDNAVKQLAKLGVL